MLLPAGSWATAQGAAEGSDWPQYQGGPGHSGSMVDGPQPPFRERWRLPAPAGEALSIPVIVGELAVTVGREAVYGVDLATGDDHVIVARDGGPLSTPAIVTVGSIQAVLFLEGPRDEPEPAPGASGSPSETPSETPSTSPSSPSPGEEVVASDEPSSRLAAVSLQDGSELWPAVPLPATSRSGVTVDGTTAYVGDEDGHVLAVDISDGSVAWTAEVPGRVDVPVAASGGKVFVVARDTEASNVAIVALDASTGQESWKVFPQATSAVGSAPAAGEGFVLVGSADRLVRSISADDGSQEWGALVLSFFSPVTAPAFSGEAVYAADLSGGLYRFDTADGHRVWSHQLNEVVIRSAPVVSGPTVLLGLNDGRLVAVDAESGHLVWQSEATPGLIGSIALGPDVVVAVKGGKEAGLIAFEPDPEGALVDVPSPTELDPGTLLVRYGAAAAIVLVVVLVPGILLRRRFGPADLSGGLEPEDALEPDDEADEAAEDEPEEEEEP